MGALAIVPYLTALRGEFVRDVPLLISRNMALLGTHEWLAWFLRDFYWGSVNMDVTLYRPLTILSFLVQLRTTGLSPFPFLLGNVLLHAGVSWLVFRLGARLVGRLAAFVGAVIFAVHPLHTEAVAYIMGRSDLLAALFALAACLGYLRATDPAERRPGWWSAGAVGAYLAALFSKEHVALLPLWFGLAWLIERPRRPSRYAMSIMAGSGLAFGVFLLLRAHALARVPPPELELQRFIFNQAAVVTMPFRWLTAAAVVARYALLFAWPGPLSADYSYAVIQASTGIGMAEAVGIVLILAVLAGIGVAARWAPGLALALALTPITFVLVSNIPFAIGTVMAERLTYLPSVGVTLLLGWLAARVSLPEELRRWVAPSAPSPPWARSGMERPEAWPGWALTCGLISLTVTFGARTLVRNLDWKDDYTLAASSLRVSPRSVLILTALSNLEALRGNHGRAIELAQEALKIYPKYVRAWSALIQARMLRGEFAQALEEIQRAMQVAPQNARVELQRMRGVALLRTGRGDEAEREFREAIRLKPNDPLPRLDLVGLLVETQRSSEALEEFHEVTRQNPQDPAVLYHMARAALALGDRQTAATYASRASAAGFGVPAAFWRLLEASRQKVLGSGMGLGEGN